MYHLGTLAEFNTWHETAMAAEGITPEGKIGFINGEPAPTAQRTIAYSAPYKNPNKEDEYMWLYGKYKSPSMYSYAAIPDSWLPDYVAPQNFQSPLTMVKL